MPDAPPLRRRVHAMLAPLFPAGKLIHSDQDGTRPARPYATLRLEEVATQRHLIASEPDAAGIATYRENGTATVEVMLYGGDAVEAAQEVGRRLRAPAAVRRAIQNGLGLIEVLPAQNIAELLNNSQHEARAMLEFRINHAQVFEEEVGFIIEVEITDNFHEEFHLVSAPSETP